MNDLEIEKWVDAKMLRVGRLMSVLPDHKIRNGLKPGSSSNETPNPDSEMVASYLQMINKINVPTLVQSALWSENG